MRALRRVSGVLMTNPGGDRQPVTTHRAHIMHTLGKIDGILRTKGTNVYTVTPDATVFEAIQIMAEKNVGALLVMEGQRLVGVISERDYTRKVILHGKASKTTFVREIVSARIVSATPDSTVEDCLKLMTEHRCRHLPVVQGDKVMGVVSIGDLVNWIISSQTATINELQSYIMGNLPG